MQWTWGVVAALSFAATIHAAIVLLFRFVPFPMEAFRNGYDVSFIPSLPLKWIAAVVSAASAGICEETGFRGYMQYPIEHRHGAPTAIFVSSVFFMLLHLTKGWAVVGMVLLFGGMGAAWSQHAIADEPHRFDVTVFEYNSEWVGGKPQDITHLINDATRPYAEKIISEIPLYIQNLREIHQVVLTGGGANIMAPYFEQEFERRNIPTVLMQNSEFANARGYLKYAAFIEAHQ